MSDFDWGGFNTGSSASGGGGGGNTAEAWAAWQDAAATAAVETEESKYFKPEEPEKLLSSQLKPSTCDLFENVGEKSEEGAVFTAGCGDCEQLGTGVLDLVLDFAPVNALAPTIVRIATGAMHTLALSSNGELWSWGVNDAGALGRRGKEGIPSRVELPALSPIVQISAGSNHSAVLTANGDVWVWGSFRGPSGFVGLLYSKAIPTNDEDAKVYDPICLSAISKRYGRVTAISSGSDHIVATTSRGKAVSWGAHEWQCLGRAVPERPGLRRNVALDPTPMEGLERKEGAVRAFGVSYGSFVVTSKGRVLACGRNNEGQLGLGDDVNTDELTEVKNLQGEDIIDIQGDWKHTLFLTADGRLFATGNGDCGSLGLSKSLDDRPIHGAHSRVPLQIPPQYLARKPVVRMTANGGSSAAVTSDHDLYTWGFGDNGALATGEEEDVMQPTAVKEKQKELQGQDILDVKMGGQHIVVLAKAPTSGTKRRASADRGGKRQRVSR